MIIARNVVLEYVLRKFQHILFYLFSSSIVENVKKIVRVDIKRLKQKKVLRGKLQKFLKLGGLYFGHSNFNSHFS